MAHYGPIFYPPDDIQLKSIHCWTGNWQGEMEILGANNVPVPRGPKFVPLPFCSNPLSVSFCRNRVPVSRASNTSPNTTLSKKNLTLTIVGLNPGLRLEGDDEPYYVYGTFLLPLRESASLSIVQPPVCLVTTCIRISDS
jgi:hypothetical protein